MSLKLLTVCSVACLFLFCVCVCVSDLLSVSQLQRQVSQDLAQCCSDRRVDATLVAAGHVGVNTHLDKHTHRYG